MANNVTVRESFLLAAPTEQSLIHIYQAIREYSGQI